jgi:hypothetical protein
VGSPSVGVIVSSDVWAFFATGFWIILVNERYLAHPRSGKTNQLTGTFSVTFAQSAQEA